MNAISIHNLSKTYASGTIALKGIDLTVTEGDFFALLGINGAGKTTTINVLTGLVNKTAGEVSVLGNDLDTQLTVVKQQIGVVPQEFNFNIFEKVIDIIVTQAGYYGIPRTMALERAEVVLKKLELWEKRNEVSRALSGGMKRRLLIARALIHQPKVLILDEPTAGVDVELRRGMWDYLRELNANGTTILLTTHYLEEVEQLCKNAAVIHKGEVILQGSVKELLKTLERETYIAVVDDHTVEFVVDVEHPLTSQLHALEIDGKRVHSVRPKSNRMEELFLSVTKH